MRFIDRLRPNWKNSDPEIRLRSVREMPASEQALLTNIARSDKDERVRRGAIQKIALIEAMEELAATEEAIELKNLLARRIHEQAVKALKELTDESQVDRWFKRLGETGGLEEIVRAASLPSVRLLCVEKLSREPLLCEIACTDTDPRVAAAAGERVERADLLEQIKDRSRHTPVREAAQAALKQIKAAAMLEESRRMSRKRIDMGLNALRRLAAEPHLLSLQREVENNLEAWGSIASDATPAERTEGDGLAETLRGALTQQAEQARQAEAAQATEHGVRAALEQISAGMQQLLQATLAPHALHGEINTLRDRWNSPAPAAPTHG